ncbi:hypothetical protein Hamer_G025823 [Homarus americanus]|uniref:Uncharacterized protein n=1 Tax=Homarus americanus TaxID=6706 RepID=A0A8J5MJF2_HOMAM|nr:hypothetical protein Hamer_G025823 [Homarus americanus]
MFIFGFQPKSLEFLEKLIFIIFIVSQQLL